MPGLREKELHPWLKPFGIRRNICSRPSRGIRRGDGHASPRPWRHGYGRTHWKNLPRPLNAPAAN